MPSFTLTHEQSLTFLPLPGHALIQLSPAEVKNEGGELYLPENAAQQRTQELAVRKGVVIAVNRLPNGYLIKFPTTTGKSEAKSAASIPNLGRGWWDDESISFTVEDTVLVMTHQDEVANDYIVAKLQQIVAVEEP